MTEAEKSLALTGLILRRHGHREHENVPDDVSELCRKYRTLSWRLAELQKLADASKEEDGKQVIRTTRAHLHFILTGTLPDAV